MLDSFQSFTDVLYKIKEDKNNNVMKTLKCAAIFLTASLPKPNVCFGIVLLQGWWKCDYSGLHELPVWPSAFGDELGILDGSRIEQRIHQRLVSCLYTYKVPKAWARGSACQLRLRKHAIRLFITHLSASQKAIVSLFFFFFSKNLPLSIAHIQLSIRCYADQCPKYQSSQMFARALGKPYSLRTMCILSWMF